MKRYFALLLAAVMAASSLQVSVYAANFKDMNDVPWSGAEQVISSVADLGLLSGYEDNTFRARNNVTYCEAMQMVYSLMTKAGGAALDAEKAYSYFGVTNTYGIPAWAQTAVAYGLSNGILSVQDLAKFMTDGKSNFATREDVGMIFGNAVAAYYGEAVDSAAASEFRDYWSISAHAVGQIGLLKKLGIVNGDEYGQFNPKKNINRAEMAVMLNKTYEVLRQGVGNTCTITNIVRNGENYFFDVLMADGTKEGFNAPAGAVKLYEGNTDKELSLSRLAVGDQVSVVHRNWELQSIRLLDAVTDQERFDVTGYITKATTSSFMLENENTGATDEYIFSGNCLFYLEDQKVNAKEMKDAISDRSDEYAYARVMLSAETKREDKKEDGSYRGKEEKLEVTELHVSFRKEYSASGQVSAISATHISFKPLGTGEELIYAYAEDCDFYIGDTKTTKEKALALGESGTTYAKLQVNDQSRVTKLTLSEESFDTKANEAATRVTYEIVSYTESRLVVSGSEGDVTYLFGSSNPTKNITFYTWDSDRKEFDSTSEKNAREYYIGDKDDSEEVYCRLEFNSGGKISAIYFSRLRSAWKNSAEQTDRKGTVASLDGNTLKFEGVSTAYTLLDQYNRKYKDTNADGTKKDDAVYTGNGPNGDEVRNPLIINGAVTSSLVVFQKLARSSDVELTAEIVANGDNEVIGIEATVVSAKGKLVEYNMEEKKLTLELETGETVKLSTQRKPKLTDEDDPVFTLEDVAGVGYVGSTIEVKCNSSGEVNVITVLDTQAGIGFGRVKGIATAAADGLQVEGDSNTYAWLGRKNIIIRNASMTDTSLDKLKDAIEEEDIRVYVEATLNERKIVDTIKARVEEAEGKLDEYDADDHVIRIRMDDGKKFSFHVILKPSCDVGGVGIDDLDDDCQGKQVKLKFDAEGKVSGISG